MIQLLLFLLLVAFFYWVYKNSSLSRSDAYTRSRFRGFVLTKKHLEQSELGLFVALTAKVAKADGRVDELEAELIGNMFNDISSLFPDPKQAKGYLKEIFDREKQIPYNVDEVAASLFVLLKNDPHKRIRMMEFLVNLSFIDGTLSHAEETILHKIAAYLQLGHDQLSAMLERFGSLYRHAHKESSISQAYALLGTPAGASDAEVKKAYRALVREHHPDIIKAQGASERRLRDDQKSAGNIGGLDENTLHHPPREIGLERPGPERF